MRRGSRSLGSSAQTFAGNLFGRGAGGYSSWFSFEGSGAQVNDDPALFDYNVDQWVDKFVQNAREQASHTQDEHQIWALGSDFQYQNADQPRSGIRVHVPQPAPERTRIPLYSLDSSPLYSLGALNTLHNNVFPP